VKYRIANPYKREDIPFGKWYVSGNYVDGSPENTIDNWKGVDMEKGTKEDKLNARLSAPVPAVNVQEQSAAKAYEQVLAHAGASYMRDTLDARIINDVKNRTGGFIDVQGNYPHGTAYEQTKNAWPALSSKPAPADADADGMPDDWEKKMGLNPGDAADASAYKLDRNFTNIEVYLNSIIK
jgi:hypothetical protein